MVRSLQTDGIMEHETAFIQDVKERAAGRCQCERPDCHLAEERCAELLAEDDTEKARWSPIRVTGNEAYPPDAADYVAVCGSCAARWEAGGLPKKDS